MANPPTATSASVNQGANGAPAKPTDEEIIARLNAALDDPESVPPMEVPPEIVGLVAKRIGDFPVTEEDRRRITEDYCFQYHYGGKLIAYLTTSKGRVVIAHNEDEVSLLLKLKRSRPPLEPQSRYTLDTPPPW